MIILNDTPTIEGFERDTYSGALLNSNKRELIKYKDRKKIQTRISHLEKMGEEMRNDINELRVSLLACRKLIPTNKE